MVGDTLLRDERNPVEGNYVHLLGEGYYRIAHYDQMPPFFMSVVSSSDHWLFIASTGGLTAGRVNADSALFPYETEDKLTAHSELSGGKTILRVTRGGRTYLWEPFSERYAGMHRCDRHLYKNIYGNKLLFEEINHDLELTMRVAWRSGDRFGFIRSCWLQNNSDQECQVDLLDGLQNLLPDGATEALQTNFSNLLHAYKRCELERETGLGIFSLSATLTDLAEPSESLKATAAWQVGLEAGAHLLSTDQLDAFRHGRPLSPEYDLCGRPGAYFANAAFDLAPGQSRQWHVVADVNQDSAAVVELRRFLRQDGAHQGAGTIAAQIEEDIDGGTAELVRMVAAADGLQLAEEETTTAHHFANVLFNIMRGGVFADGYQVGRADLLDFVRVRNRVTLAEHATWFDDLPPRLSIQELYERAAVNGAPDLLRLALEYLPLTFSRRHGDPSRPWNHFSINLKNTDGSLRLDYQGNWRDIFQNWEALALAYPDFVAGMIAKFLNATTVDGYNPYRVTRDGIEWEIPEPDNPWSNIGYWSDHQIIYLQKLLEMAARVQPGLLSTWWDRAIFAYANVPYRLRPYEEMLADWYNTIDFDLAGEEAADTAVAAMGSDGNLRLDEAGQVIHVTMMEKMLVLLLAKVANLVPEGGIWMNTQRPEWNDANNALVGKGLSVVTAAYLRRFVAFWLAQLAEAQGETFAVNSAVASFFREAQRILSSYQPHLQTGFDDRARRAIMDELGMAATEYRAALYENGLPGTQTHLSGQDVRDLLATVQDYLEHTLRANRRDDNMYHAYNVLHLHEGGAAVEYLYPMLEGQVAILSAGILSADEALALLEGLRHSDLYRADQHSYILYPNRRLPGFLQKNNITAAQIAASSLLTTLADAGDARLLSPDVEGVFHFNGRFRNANDVAQVLDELAQEPAYADLVASDRNTVLDLFEATFNHRFFTGRSGTFYAFEGLGSIYWHMVSKLLLAVQECFESTSANGADAPTIAALARAYYDIRQGLGFNRQPAEYGAFPTDPYSHTPFGGGARQPGMTGQVKEEILTRVGELGVSVCQGILHFAPALLRAEEFTAAPGTFSYVDSAGGRQEVALPAGSLAFTYCQTPVIYTLSDEECIDVTYSDGRLEAVPGTHLDEATSRHILARDGQVLLLQVHVPLSMIYDPGA